MTRVRHPGGPSNSGKGRCVNRASCGETAAVIAAFQGEPIASESLPTDDVGTRCPGAVGAAHANGHVSRHVRSGQRHGGARAM